MSAALHDHRRTYADAREGFDNSVLYLGRARAAHVWNLGYRLIAWGIMHLQLGNEPYKPTAFLADHPTRGRVVVTLDELCDMTRAAIATVDSVPIRRVA